MRALAMTAMLSAVAAVLMLLSFNVPLMPGFIKLDLSELPALIASFALGPWSGVAVCFLKNAVNLPLTTTGGVGELCNFLLGAAFVLPAGLLYHRRKTGKSALLGSLAGAAAMALFSFPLNFFIVYPIYTAFMPLESILGLYRAINPGIETLAQALWIFNAPFTLIKGLISVVVTMLVYKKLSPVLTGLR